MVEWWKPAMLNVGALCASDTKGCNEHCHSKIKVNMQGECDNYAPRKIDISLFNVPIQWQNASENKIYSENVCFIFVQ